MADHGRVLNQRTYYAWTDPKTGKQVSGDSPPADGSGGVLGIGGKPNTPAVQYHEVTYEDGTKIVSHFDAAAGEWKQDSVDVDAGIAAQHERVRKAATPDRPSPISAPTTQKYIVLDDGTRIENPNYEPPKPDKPEKPEPSIARPTGRRNLGPEGQDLGPETEKVSQAQATYDQQVAEANQRWARQQEQDTIAAARSLAQNELQRIANQHAEQRISLETAKAQMADALGRAQLQLEHQRNQISAASLEATQRGQDINALVQMRNQNLDYETTLAQTGSNLALQMAKEFVPASQMGGFNAALGSMAKMSGVEHVPIPGRPLPFNPRTLPLEIAQAARQQLPEELKLPGRVAAPPTPMPDVPVQSYEFKMPPRPPGA